MPRTGLSSQELVEKSLGIAADKIRQHGLDKFRLSDIARELGVSHSALYNHFPDKAALLDAISARWLDRIDAALEACTRRDLPARRLIVDWFLAFHRLKLEKVRLDPELFKSFNLAAESSKPFVLRHLGHLHDQLSTLVRKAVAEGELGASDPETAVALLFEATISFHHPHLVWERREEDRETLLTRIVTTLLAGLAA